MPEDMRRLPNACCDRELLKIGFQTAGTGLRVANPPSACQLSGSTVGVVVYYAAVVGKNEPAEVWDDGRATRDSAVTEDVVEAFALASTTVNSTPETCNVDPDAGSGVNDIKGLFAFHDPQQVRKWC